ncbi:Eisosome assembly protein [Neurospora sp. IMI 360204]|nr:Eisosome assembly protein [Neurospora sp. IMI 360204]
MASPTSNGLEVSQPQSNAAGSQAAISALRAAQRQQKQIFQQKQQQPPQPQQPKPTLDTSNWGNSAANLAFKGHKSPTSFTPTVAETQGSALTRQASLRAARDAVAGRRPRSRSQPQPVTDNTAYPDKENAASNALSAATKSMRPPSIRSTDEAGAVPYTTMSRQMFTSRPPVKPEVDEKNRQDVLHASALAMAKRMYTQQQKMIDQSKQVQGRRSSFERHGTGDPTANNDEVERPPVVYNSLQDAAYRLAQERLAKLHDEHQKNREMQEYYTGVSPSSNQGNNNAGGAFGSIRNKLTRRRSSSDGDIIVANDRQRSQHIRKQMSLFNTKIAEVDEQKRARDREALLQAAQRNVKAQLQGMDEKLYAEKGVMIPHTSKSDWEVKAHAAAQARFVASNSKRSMDAGQVNIGGGKMVDRAKVEDIAAKRVQPLLDEINDHAEKERERRAAVKMEEERKREEVEKNKMREKEVAMLHKQLKDQQKDKEKALAAEVKREERQRKEEEKAAKAEQKRLAKEAKEEKQIDKGKGPATAVDLDQSSSPGEKPTGLPLVAHRRTDSSGLTRLSMPFQRRTSPPQRASTTPDGGASPILEPQSAASPTSKVKAWLKNRFSRPRAASGASIASSRVDTTADGATDSASPDMNRGFIGGVALTRKLEENNPSVPSIVGDDHSGPGSIREVALAGLSAPTPVHPPMTTTPAINLSAAAQDEPGESSGLTTVPGNSAGALGTAALKPSSRPISAIGGFDAVATVTTIITTTTTTEPAVQVQQPQLVLPYVTTSITANSAEAGETNSVSSLSSSDLSDSVYSNVSDNGASPPGQDNYNDNENDDEFLEARSTFSSDGPLTPPSAGFPSVMNGMKVAVSVTQPTPGVGSEKEHGQFLMAEPRVSTGSGFGLGSVSGRSLRERSVSSGGLSVGRSSISGCGRISPFRESRFSENFDKED